MQACDLERKLGKQKKKTIPELKQLLSTRSDQNPNYCLFLGAGASRSSGIRTAGEMVEEWRKSTYTDLSNDTSERSVEEMQNWLQDKEPEWYRKDREYCSLIEKIFSLPATRRKFIENEVKDQIPSIGYAYLVRIAEAGLIRTIFTTNFDDLLNEAFYQFSSQRALVCAHDSSVQTLSIISGRTKIIKLHGDYLFDSIKNTAEETRALENNMEEKLKEFLKEYGLIISGYSGSDKSIIDILRDLSKRPQYLKNGLVWCFRPQDEITPGALSILEEKHSFYTLVPGFDETMAEIYTITAKENTPFNSKLASDRASNIIENYLQSTFLKSTSSEIIRKHLDALEADKNASTLSDLMKDLNSERIASSGLSDKNMLVYLEIERAMKDRNPELALSRLNEELLKANDRKFKEILWRRLFFCSSKLNRLQDAQEAIKQMLTLEPENFYMALNECSLIEDRPDRICYLENLRVKHPFSSPVLNRYADELSEALDKNDKIKAGIKPDNVLSTLEKSIVVDPSLDNEAWEHLFKYYSKQGSSQKVRERLEEIVDKHLNQNAFDLKTSLILFRYCRKFKEAAYKKKPLFQYLNDAYKNHFPRDYAAHLDNLVDACIEFNLHQELRPILEEAREIEDLKSDPQFITIMMDVHYDVFRDITAAISYGRDFLRSNKNLSIEIKLIRFLLENGDVGKARDMHAKLKGAISIHSWKELDALVLQHEKRYQDAIDTIERLPDRRDFKEKHTSNLSFLELKMGFPARARKRCREFLEDRSFSISFEEIIINYEFAKSLDRGNIDKRRVEAIKLATEKEMVKGVCHSLLGEKSEALAIFQREAEKRFSRIDDALSWPVLSDHDKDLRAIRQDLLKSKRSLNELNKIPAGKV